MKKMFSDRTWISPITSMTFLVVGITGILLAFHIKNGGIKALHEWIGYAFTLAGFVHLAINWKVFILYFRKRSAILAAVTSIILSLTVFYIGGSGSNQQKAHPLIQAFDLNRNGVIDADEIFSATASLNKLDANKDGIISVEEFMSKGGKSRKQP